MNDLILLVNEQDEAVGTMEKMEAHQKGILHRAFSVFIFNPQGELLLQQRAADKYHGAGLWTNACCSHPYPDEPVAQAATRRLQEEMGFVTPLQKAFHFTYNAQVENNLIEHEFDHVFVGTYDGPVPFNMEEVAAYRFVNPQQVEAELAEAPHTFTQWFKLALPQVLQWYRQQPFIVEPLSATPL